MSGVNRGFHAGVFDSSGLTIWTLSLCERKGSKKVLRTRVVWVIIRFSLVCLLSLVRVSFFSFKLALDRMENFKNPRSGPPGPNPRV